MNTVKGLVFLFVLLTQSSWACTGFLFKKGDNVYLAKNYDWEVGHGFLVENKRNVTKIALLVENPVKWTSKYGSLTFNQFGNELPNGGMNEAGLVVDILWLTESQYPEKDDRKAITEIQWVQYMLDNCATVEEVITKGKEIRISHAHAPIHYMIADGLGNFAIIEFINGQLVEHVNPEIPVLANNTYEASLSFVKHNEKKKGLSRTHSLNRFKKATKMLSNYKDEHPLFYSFAILGAVSQPDGYSKWSIVYDITHRKIHFKTNQYPNIKYIKLNNFSFSCDEPKKFIYVNFPYSGDVSYECATYTYEINEKLVQKVFTQVSILKNASKEVIKMVVGYPEKIYCTKED